MCAKDRFRDPLDAKLALARQKENGHRMPKECCRYYRCKVCKGYHLTSWDEEKYASIKGKR